jgi:HSP20 family protein
MNEQDTKNVGSTGENVALLPPVNVIEDSTSITLFADFPGVPKDKLNVQVDGNNLILEGELGITMPENIEASHAEVDLPRYRRVFTLSRELDIKQIAAEFQHGVLKLSIPKAEHAKPHKIKVQMA